MSSSDYQLYQNIEDEHEDLQQGDIIDGTTNKDICELIRKSYPLLPHQKYIAYLVITQTCDLARREKNENRCKAEYINFAGVQRIEDVFLSLVDKICFKHRLKYGCYATSGKNTAEQLVERICNQNEWATGVFYLQDSAQVRLAHPSVAMLQVSFSLDAKEHYQTVVNARTGRLTAPFQNRLGWLVGNLYSRVATQDYPEQDLQELKDYLISKTEGKEHLPRWLNKKGLKKIKTESGKDINELEMKQIDSLLDQYNPKTQSIKAAAESAVQIMNDVIKVPENQRDEIKNNLIKSLTFTSNFD